MSFEPDSTRGRIVVLAGPTAVGKGTVSRRLVELYPEVFLSISATTRAPRPGEIDAVHYHFVSEPEFKKLIASGQMLEWAIVHGKHYYGTWKKPVEDASKAGKPVLLEIDLAGARQVKENLPQAILVFLSPPSWEELVSRLDGRGTESEAEKTRRLETARIELAAEPEFDYTIVNDQVDLAVHRLARVLGLAEKNI